MHFSLSERELDIRVRGQALVEALIPSNWQSTRPTIMFRLNSNSRSARSSWIPALRPKLPDRTGAGQD